MKIKKLINNKSNIPSKASARSGDIISGKKKIILSRRQQVATVLVAALAVVGLGYGVYSLTYMNESFAGGCMSNTYQLGSKGTCVKHIQSLNNYFATASADNLNVDGVFGDTTRKSIRKFQAISGLSVDGVVDLATWKMLCAPQTNVDGSYQVSSNFPISAARGAGCPGADKFHY